MFIFGSLTKKNSFFSKNLIGVKKTKNTNFERDVVYIYVGIIESIIPMYIS